MANISHLLLLTFLGLLCAVAAYTGPDLPKGPFCGIRNECCRNRQDRCSHRILGTICYCDEFCNHNATHDDCCPDYEEVCLGITTTTKEPAFGGNVVEPCYNGRQKYFPGDTRMEDCNECTCVAVNSTYNDWSCSREECMISKSVLMGVGGSGFSWRATNYSEFQGKTLNDGLIYKLGTFELSMDTRRMVPISYDKDIDYPRSFDSRTRWPNYISAVADQGWCGSDWAVAIAGVTSDRFAIQSNGAENVILSPQVFLSCNRRYQQGCKGGHIDVAWNFARSHGLVQEDCFPYKATMTHCPFKARGNLLQDGCQPPNPQRTSRYRVGPPGRLRTEKDIMYDIMNSGPVQAIMTVHQDFFHYRDGVYRRTRLGDNRLQGLHSVRIVGWGEDRGDKFWIVANSWGRQWGENGYFRIARGVNESGIEDFVVTVLVDVTEATQRK